MFTNEERKNWFKDVNVLNNEVERTVTYVGKNPGFFNKKYKLMADMFFKKGYIYKQYSNGSIIKVKLCIEYGGAYWHTEEHGMLHQAYFVGVNNGN